MNPRNYLPCYHAVVPFASGWMALDVDFLAYLPPPQKIIAASARESGFGPLLPGAVSKRGSPRDRRRADGHAPRYLHLKPEEPVL